MSKHLHPKRPEVRSQKARKTNGERKDAATVQPPKTAIDRWQAGGKTPLCRKNAE